MRKIWRKDKDKERDRERERDRDRIKEKRRSFNGSNLYVTTSTRESGEFDGGKDRSLISPTTLTHTQSQRQQPYHSPVNEFHDDSTLAHSVQESHGTSNYTLNQTLASSSTKTPKTVQGLIKYEYDSKLVKNSWVNLVVNTTVNDVNDQTLRLFRAELKGSHLYLYKSNLNYRNFKINLESKDDLSSLLNQKSFNVGDIDSASISGPLSAPLLSGETIKPPEIFKQSNDSNNSLQSNGTKFDTILSPNVARNDQTDDFVITVWDSKCPHPDLNIINDHSLGDCSVESLIHSILFGSQDSIPILQIIDDLPLIPDFGKTIRLLSVFLVSLFENKFSGDFELSVILDRVLMVLNNVAENFKGFLLKSDVAPYILKILEILNENLDPKEQGQDQQQDQQQDQEDGQIQPNNPIVKEDFTDFLNRLKIFKSNMLIHQQNLINLISTNDQINDLTPLDDLNADFFLNHVKLIEFTNIINTIDLTFFNDWNSNIDKSLLLYSTINSDFQTNEYFYKKNSLFFNNEFHMHYLSRLLINHLFLETTSTSLNCSTSLLEFKARLLEKWIDLGCLLDKSGNMSSWLGIASIILSQPILRLSKIWSFVSNDYIKLLKNDWSPVLFELDRRFLINGITSSNPSSPNQQNINEDLNPPDSFHIMAPRGLGKIYPKEKVVPYFGDLIINNLTKTSVQELDRIHKRINYSFNRWNDYLKNLTNYNEIIKYNDDVLKRYDSMGFIFSNESLNQVMYLGVNNDDSKLPQTFEMNGTSADLNTLSPIINGSLKNQLLKLLDLNSADSMTLDKLMVLSLTFQPELPESYLKPQPLVNSLYKNVQSNHSNLSLNSTDSEETAASSVPPAAAAFNEASSKLPTFNDHYFKINLGKYDELYPDTNYDKGVSTKHNIKADSELSFRIDDFVSDLDNSSSSFSALQEVDENDDDEEVAGLGIDVDDILNSDKFNNFSMSNEDDTTVSSTTRPELKAGSANSLLKNQSQNQSQSQTHPTNSFSIVSSDSTQLHIYKYIPKCSSIDKLIDLLIIDSKYLDESINIDLTEYRFVFLLNYNSYITTRELLDKLAHRFINSGNAVISIMKRLHLAKTNQDPGKSEFPDWNLDPTIDLNELGEVDYSVLLKIQINILKVLVLLINNFYGNFSMDLVNKKILIKLLKLFSNEILQWYNSNKIDSNLEKSFESLVNYYKKLKKLFVKKTYRPIEIGRFNQFLINDFKFNNSLHEVPMNRNLPGHKNIHKIEKFLHKFNKLLTLFYKGIKIEDWIQIYKVLEIEFEKNNLLEFNLQKNIINDDNLIISNIFNYLDSLNDPQESILTMKRFPLVFQKLFKLYSKFKTYILIQLTDLNITVDERLDRMKTLLYMVKICQVKMSNSQFVFEGKGPIPSCIETAITNVIYSPESRLFTNLWLKASLALNVEDGNNFEDLNMLLPKHLSNSDLAITDFLLPCFGWIIQNLLEVNRIGNFSANLINMNKRYLIFKILKELTIEGINISEELNHNDTREFEFLLKLDEGLVNNKNIKEFTLLEKDRLKLFKSVLREQHKILLIDNRKKALKSGRMEKPGGNAQLAPSLNKKSSNSSIRRQSLSYKQNSSSRFKISGFFNKSRPFSLGGSNGAFSSTGQSIGQFGSTEKAIGSKELPSADQFTDVKQKPAYVIALKNKKVFPVYLLPLSFKIDSDSKDDDYFFQCLDDGDLNDWLMKLNYANRHWFFSRSLNSSKMSSATTFGIPISVVCSRQNTLVPPFLIDIFHEIESDGIKDVGIYRISTSISELNNLKTSIDKYGYIDFNERGYDTHALTSCVKSYFRELPDALLPDKVIEKCFKLRQQVVGGEIEPEAMIEQFKSVLKGLPAVNYETLKALLNHLTKVVESSDVNKMTPANIATVIGPALTEASSLEILVNNFGFMNFILEKLLINYSSIFEDQDEGEVQEHDQHEQIEQVEENIPEIDAESTNKDV